MKHHPFARGVTLAILVSLTPIVAHAGTMPWREGMSRSKGFGHCAKGPCLRFYDFSPTVPHVHVAVDGRDKVVLCTGLGRKPSVCSANAARY